jgi:hypothetical protein
VAIRSTWLLLLSCIAAGVGCQASHAHPFFASNYDPDTGCLSAVTLGDVLDGPDPGSCQQTLCWVDTKGNAHVSLTMCDGPPDWKKVDLPAPGSICAAALEALKQWGVGNCAPEAGADGAGMDVASETAGDEG